MKNVGSEFTAPHTASIALRVPDVEEARRELEAKGVVFDGETLDTRVCHMAFFRDPDGNALMLHRRYARRPHDDADTRAGREAVRGAAAAVDHRRALALHRPARLRPRNAGVRHRAVSDTRPTLDLDVAGRALVTESGIEILSAPDGVTLRAARRATTRPTLIPDDDKFAAENLAHWEHGLLVHVAEGRRAREAALRPGHLDRRHALLAHGRDRRRGRALLADRGSLVGRARDRRLHERRRRALRPARPRRSSTSRCRTSRARPGTSAATRRGSSATPSSTG